MLKKTSILISVFVLLFGLSGAFAAEDTATSNTKVKNIVPETQNSSSNETQTAVESQSSQETQKENPVSTESSKISTTSESVATKTVSEAPAVSAALPVEIQTLIQKGELLQARSELLKLWNTTTDSALKDETEIALSDVNSRLLFSDEKFPGTIEYRVKPGDSLYVIARKNKTSAHMIELINGLKSQTIRPGQKLKILPGNFSIVVNKKHNILRLYLGDQLFKRYRCATGATPDLTPEGTFLVVTKLENPTWYKMGSKAIPPGGSDNLLGTRWLGISKQGYGIHGTTIPESIGKHATSGCVRMLNSEVEELYDLVPAGTKVTITA